MGLFANLFRGGGSSGPQPQAVVASATATGALCTIARQLDPAASISIRSGAGADLSIAGATLSTSAALGAGASRIVVILEELGAGGSYRALAYALTLTTPGSPPATPAIARTIDRTSSTVDTTILTTDRA